MSGLILLKRLELRLVENVTKDGQSSYDAHELVKLKREYLGAPGSEPMTSQRT